MRFAAFFAAFLVAGLGLAGGLYLHRYEVTSTKHVAAGCALTPVGQPCTESTPEWQPARDEQQVEHPEWADPAALVVLFAGLGFAGQARLLSALEGLRRRHQFTDGHVGPEAPPPGFCPPDGLPTSSSTRRREARSRPTKGQR